MKDKANNNTIQARNIFNKELILLFTLIFLGALLRCFRLSFQSYTGDEIASIRHVTVEYFKYLSRGFFGDPPLYEFLLYFWVKLFGHSEASTRALSATFSIATIPALYFLVNNFLNKKTALFSVFLLTFSAYHIYYAQEARMYALSGFLTVTSSLFFIKALKSDRKINWIMYAVISVLAFHAHYSFLFVFLAQNITIGLIWKKYKIRLSHWLSSLSIAGVMSLPWIMISLIPRFIVPTFVEKQKYIWVRMPSIKAFFYSFTCFLWGQEFMISCFGRYHWFFFKAALITVLLIISLNIFLIFRQRGNFGNELAVIFFFLWLALPVLIVYLISIAIHPIYQVRYVDVSLFAFFVLIAHSLSRIKPVFLRIMLLSVFFIPNLIVLNHYYRFSVKSPMRDIANFLRTEQVLEEKVLVYDFYETQALQYYYPEISENVDLYTLKRIKEIIQKDSNFWLVYPFKDKQLPEDIRLKLWLGDDFNNSHYLVTKRPFGNILVYSFKRRKEAVSAQDK